MQLKEFAHMKLLIAQRLDRFVSSKSFEKAFERANQNQKERMRDLIDKLDLKPLQRLVKELNIDDLESLSFRELRELGKRRHVRYWHILPKESLIFEIEKRQDETNTNSKHKGDSGSNEDTSS